MTKRELEFRRRLIADMGGRWFASIHVENDLNPGIPDLSYVMAGPNHETGWLELKAMGRGKTKFKVESSQHQWMTRHAQRVPAHFLIEYGEEWDANYYLVAGNMHHQLAATNGKEDAIRLVCHSVFTVDTLITELSKVLSAVTKRDRHD